MKRDILKVLSLCTLLTSCVLSVTDYDDAEDVSIAEARRPPLEFASIEAVLSYAETIRYRSDERVHGVEEYWQCPYETWERGTGDCEDWAIFVAFFAESLGHQATLVAVTLSTGEAHAVVRLDGRFVDAYSDSIPLNITSVDDEWTVEEALGICKDIYGSE